MIPVKLTAIPISTMIIRALTLVVMPRLRKLITKPSIVMSRPSKTMFSSPLLLFVFPRLTFQEQHDRRAQHNHADDDRDVIDIRGEPGGDQRKRDETQYDTLRLSGIRSHTCLQIVSCGSPRTSGSRVTA